MADSFTKFAKRIEQAERGRALLDDRVSSPPETLSSQFMSNPHSADFRAEPFDLRGSAGARSEPDLSADSDWPVIQPLACHGDSEPYPLDALPTLIRDAIQQVAHEVQAPVPLIACSAVSTVSVATQGLADVQRAPHLKGPIGVFTLVIADSGERKSASDKLLSEGLRRSERDAAAGARPELDRHAADVKIWVAQMDGLQQEIRRHARREADTSALFARCRALEARKPTAPRVPRWICSDATIEALTYGLSQQWPSTGLLSNEAGIVFGSHGMSGDSIMRTVSQLNTLWDGGDIRIDRRTTESFTVRSARLTMGLMAQEPTLKSFFDKHLDLARGSGFLARVLIAQPPSTIGTRLYRTPDLTATALTSFNARIEDLLKVPLPFDPQGYLSPRCLMLSHDAHAIWRHFHDQIEGVLGLGGELYEVRDVASKAAENAARLAAQWHVLNNAVGDISADLMEAACRLVAWHLSESRRFFSMTSLDSARYRELQLLRWLVQWGRTHRRREFQRSEIQRLTHGALREKRVFAQAMQALQRDGYIRPRSAERASVFELHPALFDVEQLT